MQRFFLGLCALALFSSFAHAKDLLDVALEIRTAVHDEARLCGLVDVDAYDSSIAKPQTPAHRAWLKQQTWGTQVVVYSYRDTYFGGQRFVEKRTNGGTLGWIGLEYDSYLDVGLSIGGQVASASTFYTPSGEHFQFYCKSQPVTYAQWQVCVRDWFVIPLAQTMCQ